MATVSRDKSGSNFAVPAIVTEKISAVVSRARSLRLLAAATLALAAALVVLLMAIGIDWALVLFEPARRQQLTSTTMAIMGLVVLACLSLVLFRRVTRLDAARRIDEQLPELEERWTSLSEFSTTTAPPELRGSEAMRRMVAEEAARMGEFVEPKQIRTGRELAFAGGCLVAVLGIWMSTFLIDPGQVVVLLRRFFSPASAISLTDIRSETGDVIQSRGSNLKLEASVLGRARPSAALSIRTPDGAVETHVLALLKGETPRFAFPLKNLEQTFEYRFRSGDGQTPWHTVTVADRPSLKSVEFRIIPPAYSKLPEFRQSGLPKSAKALQGSRLVLELEANVPLKSLVLQGENKVDHSLSLDGANRYRWEAELEESWAFRPVMESADGLTNDRAPRCEIVVYNDQAPVVNIAAPTNDVAVRPDDTVTIAFDARDDLGITRAELVIYDSTKAGSEELKSIPIPLGDQVGERTVHAQAELDLKEFQLKHGAELAYAIRVYDTKDKPGTLQPTGNTPATSASKATTGPRPDSELADARAADRKDPSSRIAEPGDANQNQSDAKAADGKDEETKSSDGKPSSANNAASTPNESTQASNDQPGSENSNETDRSRKDTKDVARDPREETESQEEDAEQNQQQAGGGNTWKPNSSGNNDSKKKPGGEMAGKRRPDFHMAKHELDTPAGQCSSCARRRITIDEWAGSYASQVLEKLQLQIDPVLKELREALTQAGTTLQPVAERTRTGKTWETTDSAQVRTGDEFLVTADRHVKDLTAKSEGTPYAFIGLQLQDIAQLHILPARHHLSDVTLFDSPSNADDLTASLVHIQRALDLLEQLTRQYNAVKLNQQLADTMTRIKKMHQIFLEGTFAMLKSQKPNLNPKQRAFMELELSDEFLKRLQELLKKKLDIQAELAKVLSQDPRLLERFMARSRLEATTLRDQLTLLNQTQQGLTQELKNGLPPADKPEARLELKNRIPHRVAEAGRIAQEAAKMLDNYVIWTPRDLNVDEGGLATFKAKLIKLVATASDFSTHAGDEDSSASIEAAENLYQQLHAFKDNLPELLEDSNHPKLPSHLANRAQEAEKLVTDVSGWIRKERMMDAGHHHLAAEVDQHRITVDTMELTRKLTGLKAQCQGISPELGKSAQTFLTTMEMDLVPELESAQLTLGNNTVPDSIEHQSKAIAMFTKAETELDEVMDGIIKYLDSLPYDKNPQLPEGAEPESLQELLAMLEDEARAAEALGIPCCRPSNLLIEKDWSLPGSSSAGSGSGSGNGSSGGSRRTMQAHAQMNQARNANALAERLRKQTEDALKKLRRASGDFEAPRTARKQERKWDTLGSKLEDHMRQGRGNLPPEQYRRAIELYFESLARDAKPSPSVP